MFKLNLTMPEESSQTIVIVISVTSMDYRSRDTANQTFEFDIKIVTPITIKAEVFNMGTVDAVNVTASFFADGDLLGTQEFGLGAGDSTVLEYNWTFSSIKDGKHVVTVSIDDENEIVEFSNGNNVFSRTIYVGEQSNVIGGVLMFAVVFLAVIVMLTYLQKPAKKKKF
ncbi:MAG: hypothetical protein A3K67_07925 [Euryarchaeota archaeon RBG_16_62_10]|nr:MAG: hypothetical protein A3K67_07925 [Euryarchaeota archaeon RBG_16_62_10]